MTALLASLLAVMLLSGPDEAVDAEGAAAVSEDADRVELPKSSVFGKKREGDRHLSIASTSSDFDRQARVIRFEGSVRVENGEDVTLCSNEAFAFLSPSNEVTRIVLVGSVAITNETRSGACAWATYRRRRHEIEMFGDGKGVKALLADGGENAGTLVGTRIRFWLDTEQVEVEDADIRVKEGGDIRKEAARGRAKGR